MRTASLALFLSFSLSLSAATVVHFDPLPPTSERRIGVHVSSTIGGSCPVRNVLTNLRGSVIDVRAELETGGCEFQPSFTEYRFSTTLAPLPAGFYEINVFLGDQLLTTETLIVREADPAFTVVPDVAERGDRVRIVGAGLGTCSGPPASCATVRIGGLPAEVEEVWAPDTLFVTVPGADFGAREVTVAKESASTTIVAALFVAGIGIDRSFFEPILFPVAISGPGAFGAQWQTEVSMRNDTDDPLTSSPGITGVSCPILCDRRLPARTNQIFQGITGFPTGFVEYVPRQAAPKLWFGTLVRDLSRQSQALGTEIPVVRERDLFDRKFQILNVPTDPRFRVSLRLYDLEQRLILPSDQALPRSMAVRFQTMTSDDTITAGWIPLEKGGFAAPAAAFIGDLLAVFPELAGKGPLRIEIDPDVVPGQRTTWGFVSVTNNDTQHVTVISP